MKPFIGTEISLTDLIKLQVYAKNINLLGKRTVASHVRGSELSHIHGRGIEFDKVRNYLPGDDLRTIDWRVTARMNKPHTKVFREDRDRDIHILVDLNPNMYFGTRCTFKSVTAIQTASLIAWAAYAKNHSINAMITGRQKLIETPPSSGKQSVLNLLKLFSEAQAQETMKVGLIEGMKKLLHKAKSGSLIFIISDFNYLNENDAIYVKQLGTRFDCMNFFIYDPIEKQIEKPNRYAVTNGNDISIIDLISKRNRDEYQQHFKRRLDYLTKLMKQALIPFRLIATNETIDKKI